MTVDQIDVDPAPDTLEELTADLERLALLELEIRQEISAKYGVECEQQARIGASLAVERADIARLQEHAEALAEIKIGKDT